MLNKLYIIIVMAVFGCGVLVFNTFERSKISELEKRELATFPAYDNASLMSGKFTKAISAWYSDSEPYRDKFMLMSMMFKESIGMTQSDDNIKFHKADAPEAKPDDNRDIAEYDNKLTADENAKVASAGIIIIGPPGKVRALMAYGGEATGGTAFAEIINRYKKTFPNVNVYCMVIPQSTEFYCPDKARSSTKPELPTIRHIYSLLDPEVKAVDVYTSLGQHAKEDIYLRTDHHWAPLGAFYAAKKFAEVAGVPFRELNSYDRHVIHGYVGSMYGYSKDISVKQSPEDFVFYTPRNTKYTTTYTEYQINKSYKVTSEGAPHTGEFFYTYPDGSPGAYCTFMGGDAKITKVQTSVKNGRRVVIFKDSFGNAIPGYLFYSFEEVHVIDHRYFTKDIRQYIAANKITDILFANNIFKAYSGAAQAYERFLDGANHGLAPKTADAPAANKGKKDAPAKANDKKKSSAPAPDKKAKEASPKKADAPRPAESKPAEHAAAPSADASAN